jgi:hypothetical protein
MNGSFRPARFFVRLRRTQNDTCGAMRRSPTCWWPASSSSRAHALTIMEIGGGRILSAGSEVAPPQWYPLWAARLCCPPLVNSPAEATLRRSDAVETLSGA